MSVRLFVCGIGFCFAFLRFVLFFFFLSADRARIKSCQVNVNKIVSSLPPLRPSNLFRNSAKIFTSFLFFIFTSFSVSFRLDFDKCSSFWIGYPCEMNENTLILTLVNWRDLKTSKENLSFSSFCFWWGKSFTRGKI